MADLANVQKMSLQSASNIYKGGRAGLLNINIISIQKTARDINRYVRKYMQRSYSRSNNCEELK